eukprot:TRINITY_DN7037_c0_g1_i1.p2 TRINITY_DN7037_c0_g1~~TRINITY_DN7037_c0_g1_i1.p2  ORF type:complete len:199 (+),score=57.88 TRINITY_DN7037_c0_g1_i1:58-654(+)
MGRKKPVGGSGNTGGLRRVQAARAAAAKTVPSIYKKERPAGGKKKLVWRDQTPKQTLVASVHSYDAPWSQDKTNWWQRGDPSEVSGAWSAKLAPGACKKYMLQSALRQMMRICQVSAAYEGEGAEPRHGVMEIQYTQTDGLIQGQIPKQTTTIGAVVSEGHTKKSFIRLLPGEYTIRNTGNTPLSLHGIMESLHMQMI